VNPLRKSGDFFAMASRSVRHVGVGRADHGVGQG
jgi:hypothetical protein